MTKKRRDPRADGPAEKLVREKRRVNAHDDSTEAPVPAPPETDEAELATSPLGPGAPAKDWLGVAATALLVRCIYFFTADGPAWRNPLIDGDQYDFLAEKVANGEGFPPEPFWQPPLFPLLLGGLYRVFGHHLLVPRLFSALLTALTAALVTDLVRRATKSRLASIVAGLLLALYGPSIFYDGELLPTALGTFLGTSALWIALTRAPLFERNVTTGVATGLAGVALGPLLLLAPLLGVVASGDQGLDRGRRALRTLVTCVAAAIIVLPVTVFNFRRSGEIIPVSANAGINLWIGNNAEADATFAIRPGEAWEKLLAEPSEQGITTPGGQDAYFVAKARTFCATSPGACLAGLVHKARLLVVAREIPRNEDIYVLARQSPVLQATAWRVGTFAFPFALLFPLAVGGILAGFASSESRVRRVAIATTLALVGLAAGPVIFFAAGRYRLPMVPPLAVLAGLGIAALPAWNRLAKGGALAAFALTLWPAPLPVDAVDFEAEMWFVVGGRRERMGDVEGAANSYKHAIERRPGYTEAGFNLGLLLEKQERFGEAVDVYRGLLRVQPGMFGVRYRLVNALLSAQRLDEASRELAALQEEVPDHPTLLTTRAKLLLLADKSAEAKLLCEHALELTQGQHKEAVLLLQMIERLEGGKPLDGSDGDADGDGAGP